jgi:putative transcriptional regulator
MNARFHPEAASLMSYAAGAIGEPFAVLIAAHAQACPACRAELAALNALGAALACDDAGACDDEIDRMMNRLGDGGLGGRAPPPPAAGGWPDALARLVGGDQAAVPWRAAGPGLEMHRRAFATPWGEQALRFLRAAPGFVIPEHGHPASEMTMVLEGALEDGDRLLTPGDLSEHADDVWHAPRACGAAPCVCVIAEEGPPIVARERVMPR